MCTVSWIHEEDGYDLLCNRDERRTRKRALAPAVYVRNNVAYVSPADGEFGGTWITVNEFGVAACLLNGASSKGVVGAVSRGVLLRRIADVVCVEEASERLRRMDLSLFSGFTLLLVGQNWPAVAVRWDGVNQIFGPAMPPLISSSFDHAGVHAARLRQFRDVNFNAAGLAAFHASHGAHAGPYSPCMHRPDAETVSFSHVKVAQGIAELRYTPDSPCRRVPQTRLAIPLRT